MTRQEKYPDTSTFHFYNANPKGKLTTDCTIRAISEASGESYNDIVMKMAEYHCRTGIDPRDGSKGLDGFLSTLGFIKHAQPRKTNNKKYTGEEFCEVFERITAIAHIGGHHVVCIKVHEGRSKIWDIWNCSYKCIGNFWTRK